MEFPQRVSGGIERGVRTVLENPSLLIGLMVPSLLLERFTGTARVGQVAGDPEGRMNQFVEEGRERDEDRALPARVGFTELLLAALGVVAFRSSEEA